MKLAVSLMNMGLMIDLVGAAILFALGHFIRHASGVDAIEPDSVQILGYTLLAASAAELVLVFVLRRRWVNGRSPQLRALTNRESLHRQLRIMFLILFLVALSPSVYGFLYFIMGGSESIFVLMLASTLLGYMLVRMRPDDLESALEDVDVEDPG
jgi:hypothetical protein